VAVIYVDHLGNHPDEVITVTLRPGPIPYRPRTAGPPGAGSH
jgi:hypothetical protein